MEKANSQKNLKKQIDREATIKHYVLGYILECMLKNDVNVTVAIRRFLVYDLKLLEEDTFITCLKRARFNDLFDNMETNTQYKKIKEIIKLPVMSKTEQLEIIEKLQKLANEYDGVFVNSGIAKLNFEKVKKNFNKC